MPQTLAAQIGDAAFLCICALSFWLGGRTERIAASFMAFQVVLSSLVEDRQHLYDPQYGFLVIDLIAAGFFGLLAFQTERHWTLWATAFQLLSALTHVTKAMDPSIRSWGYITTAVIWGYAVLASLLIGSIQAARSRRR